MERLSDAAINIINDLHTERLDYTSEYLPLIDALNRLAEYEDTKISPTVIKELYALAKLRVADVKDSAAMIGRLVILPCKIGDTLYCKDGKIAQVSFFFVDREIEMSVIFDCNYDCEYCAFNSWHQDYPTDEYSCNGEFGEIIIPCSEIGKTVFLTKEEAEQALKGEIK